MNKAISERFAFLVCLFLVLWQAKIRALGAGTGIDRANRDFIQRLWWTWQMQTTSWSCSEFHVSNVELLKTCPLLWGGQVIFSTTCFLEWAFRDTSFQAYENSSPRSLSEGKVSGSIKNSTYPKAVARPDIEVACSRSAELSASMTPAKSLRRRKWVPCHCERSIIQSIQSPAMYHFACHVMCMSFLVLQLWRKRTQLCLKHCLQAPRFVQRRHANKVPVLDPRKTRKTPLWK